MSGAPSLADVVELLETWYPRDFAENWDRVGLVVGEDDAPVRSIVLAVDPTVAVADDAHDSDVLITHHPLLLRGASFLPASTGKGAVVTRLIRSGTALWCGHTNADRAVTGTAIALADALDLTECRPLEPPRHEDERLFGLGMIAQLPEPTPVGELAARVAALVPATVQGAKFTGDPDRAASTIALCPGAGDSLLGAAAAAGVDVYLTSDLRHHPALEHLESAADPRAVPALIDVPHYASEWMWLPVLARQLEDAARERDWDLDVRISDVRTDPWTGSAPGR